MKIVMLFMTTMVVCALARKRGGGGRPKGRNLSCPALHTNTGKRKNQQKIPNVQSMEACSRRCQKKGNCNFWTWHDRGSGKWQFYCVLMSNKGKLVSTTKPIVSGHRNCDLKGRTTTTTTITRKTTRRRRTTTTPKGGNPTAGPANLWTVNWSGGGGSSAGAYYDRPANSSDEAHRVCETSGGVVAEMDSQNELYAVLQYAKDNLNNSNAICERLTDRETCYERNFDYYRNDINLSTARTSDRRNSPEECQNLCREREGCRYFTWKKTPQECFLKNAGGPGNGNFDAEAISGPKACGTRRKRAPRNRARRFSCKYVDIWVVMRTETPPKSC